jgi:c-di-GMP-binding flagellar brake protein YcgR
MSFELLCDASGAGWWPESSGAIAGKLQSAEGQIVILLVCALAAIRITMAVLGKRSVSDGFGGETIPLTDQGPIFTGSRGRLTVLSEQVSNAVEGVVESIDRQFVCVTVPRSAASRIRIGSSMAALFPVANVAFKFTGVVQDRSEGTAGLTLFFPKPDWMERIQRREHHRVRTERAASVTRVDSGSPSSALFSGVVQNLSGTGILLCLPFRPPDGSILRVRIALGELEETSYEVRVMRAAPARMPHGGMWAAGCEFLWMDESAQARLTRACMEIERSGIAAARKPG